MLSPAPSPQSVRFGDFELHLDAGELRRGGNRVSLPEQPLRLLEVLLEHPGVVVSRDRLRERLWAADTFVDFEHGLNAAVKRLRDALGDSADQPRFIETVPKRGYRFIATLIPTPAASVADEPQRWPGLWRVAAFLIALVALGLVADRWMRPRQPAPVLAAPVAPNETRLTFGSGLQTEPAWSPDGRMVAYVSAVSGKRDVWVQPIAGGEAIQLTKSAVSESEPSWAGDGTIAFRVEGPESGIYAVQGLGGPPQRLTTFGVSPKWSPDSRLLLFGSTGEGLGVRHGLFVGRRDGRPPVRILERETGGLEDLAPWVWHPDSRRVSFVGSRPGDTYRLYTATYTGGALIETAIPDEVRADVSYVMGLSWSPDGESLIVHGQRGDETSSLWRLSVDPHTLQTRGVDRLKSGGSVIEAPVLNASGSSIAYGRPSDSRRLWRVPLDATGTRVFGKGAPITEGSAWVVTSDLSPDERTIICTLRFAGSEREEVRLVAADTGESRTLVGDAKKTRGSWTWSPDGRSLAFRLAVPSEDGKTSENAIAVRRVDLSEDRIVTTPRKFTRAFHDFVAPSGFSLDGDNVLAASDYFSPHFTLALFPIAAAPTAERSARIVVSDPGYNLWQGKYSPNGKWLAFVAQSRKQARTTTIEVVPASGGGDSSSWVHVTASGMADKPRWSVDGERLYFIVMQGGFFNVWAVPFDPVRGHVAGPAYQVTHFDSQDHMLSTDTGWQEPAVSRRFLYLLMTERTGSIWRLDGVGR